MIFSVHQPQYIPWLGFFHKLLHSDIFVFLDDVQYKKREFQNRNKIRTKDGWMWLTIPVLTKNKFFQKINEVKINNTYDWRKEHWKSILCNYSSAPYFDELKNFFEEIYKRVWERLIDISLYILDFIFAYLEIKTHITFSSQLNINKTGTERIIEIARKLKATTYLSGVGGKEYLEEKLLFENGVNLAYQFFQHPIYKQNFEGFVPYLSIIDLLFNYGKKSKDIIKGYIEPPLKENL